jgi:predicted TIM-barrel fold metal-dependent hydrolase
MKLGRFIVDTHVHGQRFATKQRAQQSGGSPHKPPVRYNDVAAAISDAVPYDNSERLLFDMNCYGVDMCVLLPAFGMTNELNLEIVRKNPGKFVAVCSPTEAIARTFRGEPWDAKEAARELDALLSTGEFVGIGEGCPTNHSRRTTMSQTERLDEMRIFFDVARKHSTVMQVHTGIVMGYPLTHHFWPESLYPIWMLDLAQEYPDVTIVLNHGGVQGSSYERFYEEALIVAGSNDNVYLETGLWWSELYGRALRDPNIGAEKLMWGTDWGASIDFHNQFGHRPGSYGVQIRKKLPVNHQVDYWGWSLRELQRLDVSQDDLNLILGGNAARIYGLKHPISRLFRDVGREMHPQPGAVEGWRLEIRKG